MNRFRTLTFAICILAACAAIAEARPLKLHAIFTSHMVLQRDKPIMIWGWADAGDEGRRCSSATKRPRRPPRAKRAAGR